VIDFLFLEAFAGRECLPSIGIILFDEFININLESARSISDKNIYWNQWETFILSLMLEPQDYPLKFIKNVTSIWIYIKLITAKTISSEICRDINS